MSWEANEGGGGRETLLYMRGEPTAPLAGGRPPAAQWVGRRGPAARQGGGRLPPRAPAQIIFFKIYIYVPAAPLLGGRPPAAPLPGGRGTKL